jgi:hypothetical protein
MNARSRNEILTSAVLEGIDSTAIQIFRDAEPDSWPTLCSTLERAIAQRHAPIQLDFIYQLTYVCAEIKRREVLQLLKILGQLSGKGHVSVLTDDGNWGHADLEFERLPFCMAVYFHVAASLGLFDLIFDHMSASPFSAEAEEIFNRKCHARGPRHFGQEVYFPPIDGSLSISTFKLDRHPWHKREIQEALAERQKFFEHKEWWTRVCRLVYEKDDKNDLWQLLGADDDEETAQKDRKVIIHCKNSDCHRQLRVPAGKRLKIRCPICHHEFEATT